MNTLERAVYFRCHAIWGPWNQQLKQQQSESLCQACNMEAMRATTTNNMKWKWKLPKKPEDTRIYISVIFAVKEWGEGQGSSRWRTPTKASWWDGRVPKREYVPSEFNGKQISSYFSLICLEIQLEKKKKTNLQSIWCWLSSQLIWMQLDKADISDNSY